MQTMIHTTSLSLAAGGKEGLSWNVFGVPLIIWKVSWSRLSSAALRGSETTAASSKLSAKSLLKFVRLLRKLS